MCYVCLHYICTIDICYVVPAVLKNTHFLHNFEEQVSPNCLTTNFSPSPGYGIVDSYFNKMSVEMSNKYVQFYNCKLHFMCLGSVSGLQSLEMWEIFTNCFLNMRSERIGRIRVDFP